MSAEGSGTVPHGEPCQDHPRLRRLSADTADRVPDTVRYGRGSRRGGAEVPAGGLRGGFGESSMGPWIATRHRPALGSRLAAPGRTRGTEGELRDRIRYLERQVEEERAAHRHADTLLGQFMQRVPQLVGPQGRYEERPQETETAPEERASGRYGRGSARCTATVVAQMVFEGG